MTADAATPTGPQARDSCAPATPTPPGSPRRGRRPRRLRGLRARRADVPARPLGADRPFASLEGADPLPRRHGRVVTFDGAATARPTDRTTPGPTRTRESRPTSWPSWTRPDHGPGGARRALRRCRLAAVLFAAGAPGARRRDRRLRAGVPLGTAPGPVRSSLVRRRTAARMRAGPSTTATTGVATSPASSSSSSRSASRAAFDQAIEDCVGWAAIDDRWRRCSATGCRRPTAAETPSRGGPRGPLPVLLVHRRRRRCQPPARRPSPRGAHRRRCSCLEGGGHIPGPHPVSPTWRSATSPRRATARRCRDRPRRPRRTWTRGLARRRRALYISSPIGLGHAQRDVAIAAELRKLHPDLQIDWLAQSPVTTCSRRTASGSTR